MMRNKLGLILLISGAALTGACVKSHIDLGDRALCFAPVAEKTTKAIIEGTSYPTAESFKVSAYYEGTDAYFENLTASYSSTNALWETTPSQYWPLEGSLTFYAYSPASASDVSMDENGFTATDYTIQTSAQMTTDLCYASATVADCDAHPSAVGLTFSHALTQLVFRVKAAAYYSSASISLTSLKIKGIYSIASFGDGAWSDHDELYTYTLSTASTGLSYDSQNRPETLPVCSYLFLPQELSSNTALEVGYTVVTTTNGTDYTLENPPVTNPLTGGLSEWEPGKKYIYTLNIGMDNVITFTASVVGWADENANIIVEEN